VTPSYATKATASSGACGEIKTTVSAPLLIMRSVSSTIALIDFCTSTHESWPTSGTIIGGCGAMPAKTNELAWAMTQPLRKRISHRLTQMDADQKEIQLCRLMC